MFTEEDRQRQQTMIHLAIMEGLAALAGAATGGLSNVLQVDDEGSVYQIDDSGSPLKLEDAQ